MQAATADQVSNDYGLVTAKFQQMFRDHTQHMAEAVGTEMHNRVVDLLPAVALAGIAEGARLGRMKVLANYLSGNGAANAGADPAERADLLCRFNTVFQKTENSLPLGTMNVAVHPAFNLQMVRSLVVEWMDTNAHTAAWWIAYRTAIADAWRVMVQLREEVLEKGGAATSIHLTIAFLHQHILPFTNLRAANVMAIDRARRSAPANSAFAGFPQWGVGNSIPKSTATNLRNHFLKHVLDADPLGHDLDWKDELRHWWAELGVTLRRSEAAGWLNPNGMAAVAALFNPATGAASANDTLPMNQVLPFIAALKAGGHMNQPFKDGMSNRYEIPYRDRALAAGRAMTDKMVHCNRADANTVFVSGADGDIFVIARFEGPVLGISSCYFAQDRAAKLADRVQLWTLL
ncbi:hypothetical protein [Paraburkholderia sp.]|uniref:hypothetical protein n=1 Tax=Paraburkholderia sp. TaxID=1926495 RepID=UPI0025EAD688|nr:hypothetical protein [Paraburkholderia sp.]